MTSFSFFKYFDAFELDVNVVNFVYYGKTRLVTKGNSDESITNFEGHNLQAYLI